ncbi:MULTISPECIES: hypothetical protein [Pseudomonas]|uniref:hypothetical protein n=1 Tax=Pseudomonas TaxID=286 RepID=UPI001474D3B7|nr:MULTISPECIES: hypothetical protein [Pseudomonas]MEC4242039.1 hypothetical protein [Pseudomonas sp. DSV-1]NNB33976.1 hypothetical protein [Pseudomonas fragi]
MNLTAKIDRWKSTLSSWIGSHTNSGMTIDAKIAAFIFAGNRSDYYLYLADTIAGTLGRKSLVNIFDSDVVRYGKSARGKLSQHWSKQYTDGGGSLQKTFAGTLPDEDVAVLDTLLRSGGERALENALRDLAENSELLSKARMIIFVTMLASLVCLGMTMITVIAMPIYTVPKITEAFSMLPYEFYPKNAKDLVGFAEFVKSSTSMIVMVTVAVVAVIMWSLSFVTGKPRLYLDKYGIFWALYRDFQNIRFLSTLAALVREGDKTALNLKLAIEMQLKGASRWKKYHLDQILSYVSRGRVGPEIFTTGIMDQKMQWYIADLVESRGLSEALQVVKERLKDRVLKRITKQAAILAWSLMISAILVSGYLMMWHMTVIDDLRRALQMFLS